MKTEQDYKALVAELRALEEKTGLYLTDENVDRENCFAETYDNQAEFWDQMFFIACHTAGQRGEEAGHNVNKLLGRTIY